ncbi:MAG: HlyD family efflux transporter periplasmic adaptor subunit [Rhodocyclaceae bacterium]|nr:HlyD family efflux transporter periplasmic adaptor subunit [Rhodocyclaceae bacterium]
MTSEGSGPAAGGAPAPAEQDHWRALAGATSPEASGAAWLSLLCASIPGTVAGLLILENAEGRLAPAAVLPADAPAGGFLAQVAETSLAEGRPVAMGRADGGGAPRAGVAHPIHLGGSLAGVVVVEVVPCPEARQSVVVRQLQWGLGRLEAFLWQRRCAGEAAARDTLRQVLDGVAAALEAADGASAAEALVTELATRLRCDRVSIGLAQGDGVRLRALSHSAQFRRDMALVGAIEAAMDEALAAGAALSWPGDDRPWRLHDHESLARGQGDAAVLTVPFAGGGEGRRAWRGAVCLERSAGPAFGADEAACAEAAVAAAARVLELRRAAERHPLARLGDAVRDGLRELAGPRRFGAKLGLLGVVLAGLFLAFATGDYRVSGKATLEGRLKRILAAPFDGYVAEAHARAGDLVRQGGVLARLDDRDLRLERIRHAAQHAQYARQYQDAVAKHDRGQASVIQAQMVQAEAQLALAEEQIGRAVLAAPFDGLVVSGDLSQTVGGAVRKGQTLFEVAPLEGYRVIVQVDDADIADVRAGQKGRVVLAALPDEGFAFTVAAVTPVTEAVEGGNVFRVEATLDAAPPRLRPGMEGVAKIEAGERRLAWIWTRRFVSWLRLFLWTWVP